MIIKDERTQVALSSPCSFGTSSCPALLDTSWWPGSSGTPTSLCVSSSHRAMGGEDPAHRVMPRRPSLPGQHRRAPAAIRHIAAVGHCPLPVPLPFSLQPRSPRPLTLLRGDLWPRSKMTNDHFLIHTQAAHTTQKIWSSGVPAGMVCWKAGDPHSPTRPVFGSSHPGHFHRVLRGQLRRGAGGSFLKKVSQIMSLSRPSDGFVSYLAPNLKALAGL